MKELLCVGYVNGLHFLRDSLLCYHEYFDDIRIINNSLRPIDIPDYKNVSIIDMPISLDTAQTVNWARHLSIDGNFDVLWMPHHDFIITDKKIKSTKTKVFELYNSGQIWGAVFTFYDVFCAFNVQALKDVGGWDSLRFKYYTGDVDFYGRMEREGWPIIHTGDDDVWHHESAVIKEDEERNFVVQEFALLERELYKHKWKDDAVMRSKV